MTVGIPKEVKTDEFRVGATPFNVATLIDDGHTVLVQSGAGEGSGFDDTLYRDAGAEIAESAEELYARATLIVKVKEPQPSEYDLLNERHTLFCYLHLAPMPELVSLLAEKKVCAIAYETVTLGRELPLLKPMSEIAGKMAPSVASHHLSRYQGGEGVLMGGAVGVAPANVLIIGAGNAGFNAAKIAVGMGADVTVLNRSAPKLVLLQKVLPSAKTAIYSPAALRELLPDSDVIISTVLIHGGATTPKLITRDMLRTMKKGSILVDITIDQGGIAESSRPTTHTDPIFVEEGVLHYCVANMPGAYPKTATVALTNATLPYIRKLAKQGSRDAVKYDTALSLGVNLFNGAVTNPAVAETLNLEFKALKTLL
ncbi:MAG: alanine dehydrogenase [Campylobacterota bacterium]